MAASVAVALEVPAEGKSAEPECQRMHSHTIRCSSAHAQARALKQMHIVTRTCARLMLLVLSVLEPNCPSLSSPSPRPLLLFATQCHWPLAQRFRAVSHCHCRYVCVCLPCACVTITVASLVHLFILQLVCLISTDDR